MTEQEATALDSEAPESPVVPEYYVNSFNVSYSAYDAVAQFGRRGPRLEDLSAVVNLRMSLPQVWVLGTLLIKSMREFIKTHGPITLPRVVVEELGLVEEYEEQLKLGGTSSA